MKYFVIFIKIKDENKIRLINTWKNVFFIDGVVNYFYE